ncbi:TniQ family protein [Streptomyces diastatochromogenes]|uniref:TniQ family protein n=1 Tax=Streptomyces diastatochromogenes TaxID=42236 RepID=UPI003690F1C1
MRQARTLPLRRAPLLGEALDSWLEALAQRLRTPLGEVMLSIGLPPRGKAGDRLYGIPPDWTILLGSRQAAALSAKTGLDEAHLHAMTLRHYDQRALEINNERRFVNRRVLWGRGAGSRFCPDCLAEPTAAGCCPGGWAGPSPVCDTTGCWPTVVRAVGASPVDGLEARNRPPAPRHCGNASSTPGGSFTSGCGLDLTQTHTRRLPVGHPTTAAQALVSTAPSGSPTCSACLPSPSAEDPIESQVGPQRT